MRLVHEMKAIFVGIGSIGTRHVKDFYNECMKRSITPEITAYCHQKKKLPESIENIVCREITELDDTVYDAAFITNPTNLHYQALFELKGKANYYFIEKPIFEGIKYDLHTLDIDSSNSYVACPMRHTKTFRELKKIAMEKKPYYARVICSSYLPGWRPNIDYRKNYSAIEAMGGGVGRDLIHDIDYIIDLFGMPEAVRNFHGKYSQLEITSDDLSDYLLKYNGAVVNIHLDYFGREYKRTCELYTEEGTFTADFYKEKIFCPDQTEIDCHVTENEEFVYEMKYFLDFMKGRAEVMNSPEHAYGVLKIALGEE